MNLQIGLDKCQPLSIVICGSFRSSDQDLKCVTTISRCISFYLLIFRSDSKVQQTSVSCKIGLLDSKGPLILLVVLYLFLVIVFID